MQRKMVIRLMRVFVVILASAEAAVAQTGGGLCIKSLEMPPGYQARPVVKCYSLDFQGVYPSVRQYSRQQSARMYKGADTSGFVFMPPYLVRQGQKAEYGSQRLQIIATPDTMTIDFFDISPQFDTGRTQVMDKIRFFPGYFSFYLNPAKAMPDFWQAQSPSTEREKANILSAIKSGLTTETMPLLFHYRLLNQHRRLRRIVYDVKPVPDTVYQSDIPMYDLAIDQVEKWKNGFSIQTNAVPFWYEGQRTIRFRLFFVPQNPMIPGSAQTAYDKEQVALQKKFQAMLSAWKERPLFMNRQPFNGLIKAFYPFSHFYKKRQSGVDMEIFEFRDGMLVSHRALHDVSVENESVQIRPAD